MAKGRIPLGRMGKAEEFARMACFLCSDAGSFITGVAINVDGGASPGGLTPGCRFTRLWSSWRWLASVALPGASYRKDTRRAEPGEQRARSGGECSRGNAGTEGGGGPKT